MMAMLKDLLMDPLRQENVSSQSKMMLTCTGVHVFKRIICGNESEESVVDFKKTLALLFVLLVLCNREVDSESGPTGAVQEDVQMREGEDDGEDNGEEDGGEEGGEEGEEGERDTSLAEEREMRVWLDGCYTDYSIDFTSKVVANDIKPDLRCTTICRLCMQIADKRADVLTFESATELACHFFHQSSYAMSLQIFNSMSKQGEDFLTLSSASFLAAASSTNSVKLAAIADIAESEAGQSVLRDFILSFTLPLGVIGVRKTCLLTRHANNRATREYPAILGEAHDAAMRGAEYSFADDPKRLHKTCALLAGIAVILTKNAQSVRRDDAFRGRVILPFLETNIEKQYEFLPRLQYIFESDDWVVYRVNGKTGLPVVEFRGSGYEGCCQACLLFMSTVEQ